MEAMISALHKWIRQRPGLEPANYISGWHDADGRRAYRSEVRRIGRQLADARTLLAYVERSGMAPEYLHNALSRRRLTWNGAELEYCTGQYWPTEYRAAAASALASAIWYHWADDRHQQTGSYEGAADAIYRMARSTFGRGIADRWFR